MKPISSFAPEKRACNNPDLGSHSTLIARRIYFIPRNRCDVDARMDAPITLGDPEIVTIDQIEGRAMDSDHAFERGLFDTPEEMIHWIYETYALAESAKAATRGA